MNLTVGFYEFGRWGQTRSGVITFIGMPFYIEAALAAVASVASFAARGTDEAARTGLSDDTLPTVAIMEGVAALILIAAATNLMSGSRGVRLFAAVVVGISCRYPQASSTDGQSCPVRRDGGRALDRGITPVTLAGAFQSFSWLLGSLGVRFSR